MNEEESLDTHTYDQPATDNDDSGKQAIETIDSKTQILDQKEAEATLEEVEENQAVSLNENKIKEEQIEDSEKPKSFTLDNKGSIESSNIAKGKGNIQNIFSPILKFEELPSTSSQEDVEEDIFSDPTTELKYQSEKSFEFKLPEIEKYHKFLLKENIIIISCFDLKIASEFAFALGNAVGDNCRKRLLTFKSKETEDLNYLTLKFLSENHPFGEQKTNSVNERTLLIVNGVGLSTQLFWDSLASCDYLEAEQTKQELKSLNRYIICLAEPETINQIIKEKHQGDLFFVHYQIPFLSYLLKSRYDQYPDDYINQLQEKITFQKKRNLWGDSEQEFYNNVYVYIRDNELVSEVEKRDRFQETDDKNTINKKLKPVKVDELFKEDEELENIVLYTASFFPELNPHDFEEILLRFIENETTTYIREDEIIDGDGNIKIVKREVEKPLKEIWSKNPDRFLKKRCHLKSVSDQGLSRIIDFDLPYLRKELRSYLEEEYSFFLRNRFNHIQELGLLFDSSLKITENVINIYTDMMLAYPDRYGEDWLVEVVLHIVNSKIVVLLSQQQFENYAKQELEELGSLEKSYQEHRIQTLQDLNHDFYSSNLQLDFIFSRVSDLIREMLNHTQLQDIVNNFLEQLIAAKRHDAVLLMVKRLRFAPQFNEFYWLRQLLERGTKNVSDETYSFLFYQAKQRGYRIYELLENLKSWLPEKGRKNYSKSNKYALSLFRDYCIESTENLSIKHYGKWQSKHPLFAIFSRKPYEEYLETLAVFLFASVNSTLEENSLEIFASLLAEWWIILHGFNKNSIHPEALDLFHALLSKIIYSSDKKQENDLINCWYSISEYIYASMEDKQKKLDKFKMQNFSEALVIELDNKINMLNRRRQLVNQLIKNFKQLTLNIQ